MPHPQLYASEGFIMIAISSQHRVDGIEQIASYHRDLVDNQQVKGGNDATFLLAEIKLAFDTRIGHIGSKGQLEEGMDSHTTRIDGGQKILRPVCSTKSHAMRNSSFVFVSIVLEFKFNILA